MMQLSRLLAPSLGMGFCWRSTCYPEIMPKCSTSCLSCFASLCLGKEYLWVGSTKGCSINS